MRVVVLGASGSGKTTFASKLSRALDIPHIELDAIYHRPNWTPMPADEFRARVSEIIARESWIIDGGYGGQLGRMVTDAADTVIWLDLPLPRTLARLLKRTVKRTVLRTELWNGNRESLKTFLWGWDALLPWTIRRHGRYRRELPLLMQTDAYRAKTFVRLRSQRELDRYLASHS